MASRADALLKSEQSWFVVVVASAAAIFSFNLLRYTGYVIDDAFITFTFAKNFAGGQGLYLHQGNHAEANSSFLWSLLLAGPEWIGIGAEQGSQILGGLFMVGAAGIAARLGVLITETRLAAPIVLIFCAVSTNFVLWSFYGLENALVAFLLVWAALVFALERRRGGGLMSLLPILLLYASRPEGFVYVAIFALNYALDLAFFNADRADRGKARQWLLFLALGIGAYEAFGYWYYGFLLPNAAYAKIDSPLAERIAHGLAYGAKNIATAWPVFALPLLVLVRPQIVMDRDKFRDVTLVGSLIGANLIFAVLAGGDWMPFGRFFSMIVPLMGVGFATALVALEQTRMPVVFVGLLALWAAGQALAGTVTRPYLQELRSAELRVLDGTADYLNGVASPTDAVAASDIGRLAYRFKGQVIDWWGLADTEIARSGQSLGRIKARTILRRNPRFIVLYSTAPALSAQTLQGDMARLSRPFVEDPEFWHCYQARKAFHFWRDRYHIVFERAAGCTVNRLS